MKELLIGLLGGGALAELLNIVLHARNNKRKLRAEALDSEVTTMEHTMRVLAETVNRELERFEREREQMQAEIAALRRKVEELQGTIYELRRA